MMANKPVPSLSALRLFSDLLSSPTPRHRLCQQHIRVARRNFHNSSSRSELALDDEKAPLRTPELRHHRRKDGELVPKPLNRPLGLTHPPRAGENTGIDDRSMKQRRADYLNYEQHLKRRRKILYDTIGRSHFHDIGNLGKIHKGKSILAPQTPFKATLALYFPNLQGRTLQSSMLNVSSAAASADTTPAFQGKVTIVSMQTSDWATAQALTFTSRDSNPALHEFLESYEPAKGLAQFATINVEENWLKRFMIRVCWPYVKKQTPKEQHATYFLNHRGVSDEIRDALGMWNSRVGYVYLLDGMCRVRWAGNGNARADEKESLVRCVKRLVDEARGLQRIKVNREEPRVIRDEVAERVLNARKGAATA